MPCRKILCFPVSRFILVLVLTERKLREGCFQIQTKGIVINGSKVRQFFIVKKQPLKSEATQYELSWNWAIYNKHLLAFHFINAACPLQTQ